jgi:hypothetical protein
MIQYFIDMQIEKQTWTVLSVVWVMLVVSATIREKSPPGECRNWARAMGFVGVGLMSLQMIHVTMLVKELNTELMVRRGSHDVEQTEAVATEIADPVRVVAVTKEYSATSPSGLHIAATKLSDGRTGSLSVVRRRGIFNADANRDAPDSIGGVGAVVGGSDGRSGSLPSGTSGVSF